MPTEQTPASVGGPRRRPRLQDIAEATGVSIKTVSRAIRGDGPVREETRARILAEADRLGFQLNDIAAGLRRKNQSMATVGVTLGDVTNPFFAPMLRGIHSVATRHQHLVLSGDAQNDADLEHRVIRQFFAHRVAGLIVAPIGDDLAYLAEEASFGAAIVFVDSPPPGLDGLLDAVTTTNEQSTREGIAMLVARGHRRIGFLGHPRAGSGALERWNGYRAALAEAGLPLDMDIVRDGLVTDADATAAAESMLVATDPPTAVFTDNNRLCTGLLLSTGYAERPVDVLSFDDFPLAPKFGVSVIDSDPYEVGRVGAELLFDRLADRGRPAQRAVVPARLVVRERA
ncbi:transcriptional regulator, LacI family [Curtobacterium sp. 9128]|uniref:LacI family DNA-binding transcriptional regulator n=1 Tax=Curtobacterium sp. 9128 TaxID=1793722 RepID=UPI0007D73459|nr:LacI family DNA-binding transcriptional regulator [Curtobacterium sp. 9128]SBN62436.1 transcriptional regulator, LacI family [Curtobacterium sp. 9128]